MENILKVLFLSVTIPVLAFWVILMFEGFVSGWSNNPKMYDSLPEHGELIDRK